MKKRLNAETLVSVLVAITIFSILFLSYSKWQQRQTLAENTLYQKQQALQIAENQIALKLAKLDCESAITQNQILFKIQCNDNEIEVRYPLGKILISK